MVLANRSFYLKGNNITGSHQTVTSYGTCLFVIDTHTHTHTHIHTHRNKMATIYKQIYMFNIGDASIKILKMLLQYLL